MSYSDEIQVRFYEMDANGTKTWEKWGTEIYVHHQFGIALKTPPYKDVKIKEKVSYILRVN